MFRKISQALKKLRDRGIIWDNYIIHTNKNEVYDTNMYYLNGALVAQMDVYDTHVLLYNY